MLVLVRSGSDKLTKYIFYYIHLNMEAFKIIYIMMIFKDGCIT